MKTDPEARLHAKYWALLSLSVLAAYGPLALLNQPFWDDWVLVAHSHGGTLWELFKQVGRREQFMLVAPLAALGEPRAWIVAALLMYSLLPPLIYTVVRRAMRWPATDAFWAAMLSAVIPLDQARFILSTTPYAFSCVSFVLSLVLLSRDRDATSIPRRLLIAVLLLIAFSTNSFLLFAWMPPVIVAMHAWRDFDTFDPAQRARAMILRVLARGELLLLPFVYWAAKQLLEPTYGQYANYNKFRMGITTALKETLWSIVDQLRDAIVLLPPRSDLLELGAAAVLGIAIFGAAAWLWRVPLRTTDKAQGGFRPVAGGLTLTAAIVAVVCAVFPYVIVGQPPRFTGLWETRHQTTLLVVTGFAIIALLRFVLPHRIVWQAAAVVAVLSLVLDISFTHRFLVDALETRALSTLLKQQPSPAGTMMFVLEKDRQYRALGRFFAFYELSPLMNARNAGGQRLLLSNREVIDPGTGTYAMTAVPAVAAALVDRCERFRSIAPYGFGGFVSNGSIDTVALIANGEPPGVFSTLGKTIAAVAGADSEPTTMVRVEREATSSLAAACSSPCCR
jgi:hypothetical protein